MFQPKLFMIAGVVLLCARLADAQATEPTTFSTPDGTIKIPVSTGILDRKDAAALSELSAHRLAVGGTAWAGMQASGTVTYGSGKQESYPATLSNLDDNRFRLDVQTSKGQTSLRIDRAVEKSRHADAIVTAESVDGAMAGLFPFEIVRTALARKHNVSLVDQGLASIGSTQLRRITYERRSLGVNASTHLPNTVVIDFYFDPSTHLLVKSVVAGAPVGKHGTRLLSAATYSDYRTVGTSLIPFLITETVQGELSQTLQLSTVTLAPALDATYFAF